MKQQASLLRFWWTEKDLIECFFGVSKDQDAVASVGELSRLHNPYFFLSFELLDDILPVEAGDVMRFWQFGVGVNINRPIVLYHVLV